jgi:tRNA G46 methylase TrmB
MLNPEFMGLMFRKLALNARVYLQTDRQPYWDYITRWMPKLFQWEEVPGDWADEPTFRSRREILARKEGLKIHRGIGAKTQSRTASEVSALVAAMEQPTFAIEHDC